MDLVVEGNFKPLRVRQICLKKYEFRSKISKLQLTKFETEHGNENYSPTCLYLFSNQNTAVYMNEIR